MFELFFGYFLSLLVVVLWDYLAWWGGVWLCQASTVNVVTMGYMGLEIGCVSHNGNFYCDEIASGLIWLSGLVTSLSLVSMSGMVYQESKLFYSVVIFLFLALGFCFSAESVLVFYVLFEVSLIPTLCLICGWGYQPERLRAGKYMMLYTVGASLPLLGFVLFQVFNSGILGFGLFYGSKPSEVLLNWVMFACSLAAFLVKSPMYLVHMWLPKAHVEAPVVGSMFLAGVLLKLGGYGLLRFTMVFGLLGGVFLSFIICLCLFGGVIASIVCCSQVDAKSLVAYSSIGHMSLVLGGLMSGSFWGLGGSVLLMLAHGLSSCGLFYLVGELYKVYNSRMLFLMRGMLGDFFGINLWLVFMCGFNAAAPPSLSLVSEVILCVCLISYSLWFFVLVGALSFLSCLYSWFLYCNVQVGNFPLWVRSVSQANYCHVQGVVCVSLILPMVGLVFCCSIGKYLYMQVFFLYYETNFVGRSGFSVVLSSVVEMSMASSSMMVMSSKIVSFWCSQKNVMKSIGESCKGCVLMGLKVDIL
uniref:NADH-ubiquinone oxidoreductase chain 4 n=1 Tax=Physunio superbus TaxID=2494254 RepID=A0A8A3WMD7_9BIVA|nr:NADH dehydrogenase subunit 4 [Physunio superbus]